MARISDPLPDAGREIVPWCITDQCPAITPRERSPCRANSTGPRNTCSERA